VNAEIGVGDCPERPEGFGHIWKSWRDDSRKSCRFCGRPGRDNSPIDGPKETGGYFAMATAGRTEIFSGLKAPMSSGDGKVKDLSEAQQAKVAEIVADKKRRDAEAVANGTARPGQIAGAKGKR
jgi:hypothetical protein